jgi:hypothetical protein
MANSFNKKLALITATHIARTRAPNVIYWTLLLMNIGQNRFLVITYRSMKPAKLLKIWKRRTIRQSWNRH